MAAASTVAISIIDASLTVALIITSMHFAAVLTSISRHLIRWHSSQDVVSVTPFLFIAVAAVIDFGRNRSWTELAFDQSMARLASIRCELTAARSRALVVRLTSHTFALVITTIGATRFTHKLVFVGTSWLNLAL